MRQTILAWTLLACLGLGLSFQTSEEKQRAAIIISSNGDVMLISAGKIDSSIVGLDVFPGDTLTTDTSGSATLLFMDPAIVRVTGGTRLVVGRDSKESYKGARLAGKRLPVQTSSTCVQLRRFSCTPELK